MKIREIIEEAIRELSLGKSFVLEHPADEKVGDWATNVALVLAKELGRNPRELAMDLVIKLSDNEKLMGVIGKIQAAGPGFINFFVSDEVLIEGIESGLKNDNWGESDFMRGKKVLVEYSSPNIAKRFSVGHLRSTIIGQAIFNLYKFSGAERVVSDNHLGDWGTQFGMIIAAIEEMEAFDWDSADINKLESIYVDYNKRIEEDPSLRIKAKEAFLRLEKGDSSAREIWKRSVEISMKEFEEIYKKLNVCFDYNFGESEYEETMPEIIRLAKEKKIASVGEEGALIVRFEDEKGDEKMPIAMLLKSDGSTTYFTRDLATIYKRINDKELKADLYVYEIGGEQKLHMRQVFEAARMLWPSETEGLDFVHVAHGRMTNEGEAMSTRKGNTIKLEDLLFRSKDESVAKMMKGDKPSEGEFVENGEMFKGLQMSEVQDIADKVSIGAVKYNELKRSPVMDYDFRWEEAMSMDGNSSVYLQYVYVRTRGVWKKANLEMSEVVGGRKWFENEDERMLARWLVMRFGEGEVVEGAARNFAPQQICTYLFETAQRFNGFYEKNKVVGVDNHLLRLALVLLSGKTIKKGLEILGIETMEKM